jgi:hypothetical protein
MQIDFESTKILRTNPAIVMVGLLLDEGNFLLNICRGTIFLIGQLLN